MFNKVVRKKSGFVINDSIAVPDDENNSDYQKIQRWIASGGIVEPYDQLEECKESKKQLLRINRDNALNNSIYSVSVEGSGCDFYLRTSDLAAIQARIDSLPNDTATKSWGCADGRRVELNKAAFQSLYRHISVNDETVYNLYAEKLQEIEQAETLEELENININFN